MLGSTAYFLREGDVYGVDVPGGTPQLLVSAPQQAPSAIDDEHVFFDGLWVDDDTIFAAHRGVLYRAPRHGGEATVVAGTLPPIEGDWAARPVRAGGFLYNLVNGQGLYRVPWGGGERTLVQEVDGLVFWDLAGGTTALYRHEENETTETWALPYDGGEPELVSDAPRHVLLGAEDEPFVLANGPENDPIRLIYGPWVVSHGYRGDEPRPSAPALPLGHSVGSTLSRSTLLARHEDSLYFVATAIFTLPDDRREERRAVLMRLSPDLSALQPVRCIPPAPFDASILEGGQPYAIEGIAASEDGVFVQRRSTASGGDYREIRQHVVKVWP